MTCFPIQGYYHTCPQLPEWRSCRQALLAAACGLSLAAIVYGLARLGIEVSWEP